MWVCDSNVIVGERESSFSLSILIILSPRSCVCAERERDRERERETGIVGRQTKGSIAPCNALRHTATPCSVLQLCSARQYPVAPCNTTICSDKVLRLQCVAVCCSVLQCVAVRWRCSVLPCVVSVTGRHEKQVLHLCLRSAL